MALNPDQLLVTTFETSAQPAGSGMPITAPVPNCYSPLCLPTALADQCPTVDTVAPTVAVAD